MNIFIVRSTLSMLSKKLILYYHMIDIDKIVGGHNVDISERPFQVIFQWYGSLICGGAWIGGNKVRDTYKIVRIAGSYCDLFGIVTATFLTILKRVRYYLGIILGSLWHLFS